MREDEELNCTQHSDQGWSYEKFCTCGLLLLPAATQQSDIDRKFRKIIQALGSLGLLPGMLRVQICQAATAGPFGQCP